MEAKIFVQQLKYPLLSGVPPTTFPEYVRYLFNFATMISGLVALGVLIWGGILYLISREDPEKVARAKAKIFGAFLGLVILLSSYLILTTINPQLAIFYFEKVEKTPPPEKEMPGIYLYDEENCQAKAIPKPYYSTKSLPDLSRLPSPFNILQEKLKSMKIVSKGKQYFAILFTDEAFNGNCYYEEGEGCISIEVKPRSIFLGEKLSEGSVVLYEKADCQGCKYELAGQGWLSFEDEEFSCPDERPSKKVIKNIVSLSLTSENSLVLLTTQPQGKGDCIFLTKENINTPKEDCINLKVGKGFNVYDPDADYFVCSLRAIEYQEIKRP